MAGTLKNLVIGAVIGAGATTGVVVPLTGDQYAEGAAKVEMVAAKDSTTGAIALPQTKINRGADGEPIVLVPGKKYRMVVEVDGKILVESEYTPDIKAYPDTYRDVHIGVFKFDVRPDRINDTAQANEVARVMGYDIPVETIKEVE